MTLLVWEQLLAPGIWSVGVRGRLDHTAVPEAEAVLNRILGESQPRIVVDLGETNYINSGGLRVLIAAWRAARHQGGDLHLCSLNRRLQEIFEIAGFDQVFTIHPTADDAARALAS